MTFTKPFITAARLRGFTLIELVMVIVIAGILAIAVVPRFATTSVFQARGANDQVMSALRYAQKVAIAQHRFVCATFTTSSLSLATGATNTCGTNLTSLSGSGNYVVNAPSGITFTASPTTFYFNALGQPSAAATITVTGNATSITVEADTGYVHQ